MSVVVDVDVELQRRSKIVAVTSAVIAELDDIRGTLADGEVSTRLSSASALLSWVASEVAVDRNLLSTAEARLIATLATDDDSVGERSDALRSVLETRGAGTKIPTIAGDPTEERSGVVVAPKQPTVDQVTEYLSSRRPGDKAHDVRTLVGGFSKVTLLVSATLDGVDQEIVLRQIPKGRKSRSLSPEFDVVSFVHQNGLPAPRPLWIEPTDNLLGGAFFATSKAPGANIGDVWGQKGASRELCLEIADLYARLHQIPVDDVNAPVSPRSTPDELRAMIAWQKDVLDKRGIAVDPVLAALLSWLEANIPVESPRKSLIHGDAAFSNLLIEDGHISAVLDWEAAHVGDVADELAYLRPSVEPVMPWAEFVERYVEAGGIEPAPESMKFFEVWSHVWRFTGCLWLAQNFEQTGRYASAVAAYVHGPRFLEQAVRAAFL